MTHQPYLDWMIATTEELSDPLTPEQRIALNEHITQCDSCRQVGEAWQAVELKMQSAPMLSPSAGFGKRWQARLETSQKLRQEKQNYRLLGILILGAFLMLAALTTQAMPLIKSPFLLLWTWIYQLVQTFYYLEFFRVLFISIFQTAIEVIPLAWLILFAGFLCQLSVVWFIALRLTTSPWRVKL